MRPKSTSWAGGLKGISDRPEYILKDISSLDPSLVKAGEKEARKNTANKFNEMIRDEGKAAIIVPTATSKAASRLGAKRGGFVAEMLKNPFLWKGFTMAMLHIHLSRAVMLGQTSKLNAGLYLGVGLGVPLTVAGALGVQASNVLKGKEPEDMNSPEFLIKSVVREGAIGFGGDALDAAVRGDAGAIAQFFGGPVLGEAEKVFGAVRNPSIANTRKLAEFIQPGNSLWYTRAAQKQLFTDQVEAWADARGLGGGKRLKSVE